MDQVSSTHAAQPRPQSSSSSVNVEPVAEGEKPKPKEACVACRTTKVRCKLFTPESAPSDVCARCTRLKIPCIYAQARRGRKPGSKRTLPQTMDKNDASSSTSSEQPRKIQKRSSSPESADLRPSSSHHEPTSAPPAFKKPPLQQQPPSSSMHHVNPFPVHSFDQPRPPPPPQPSLPTSAPPNPSYPPGPLMHSRDPSSSSHQAWQSSQNMPPPRRESYNGYPPSTFPSLSWSESSHQNSAEPSPHRYLPTPAASFQPFDINLDRRGSPSNSFHPSFSPSFPQPSSHQRRPSETTHVQPYANSAGQPASLPPPHPQQYTPYPPPTNHGQQQPYNSQPAARPPHADGRTSPNSFSLSSSQRRSSAQQHQESFLRGPPTPNSSYQPHPHHLPPLAPPPTDHPSAASTNASEVSGASRRSVPSVLSIRGLLSDVDSMSQSRPEEERELPRPPLTMAEVLDQESGIGPSVGTGAPRSSSSAGNGGRGSAGYGAMGKAGMWDDPLSLGLVTPQEVSELFDCFHNRLNLLIDILDVALHTPAYTRSTSTILFTAVLCVASKIAKPALYPTLLALCNAQLGRAFAEGVSEIGLIQALSMLAFWKETSERGSFRRVGYGIRLAFELGLHLEPKRPLPESELEARKVLDRERTWLQLVCFDFVLSEQHSRPEMIPKESRWDAEAWALDHPAYPCACDPMLASSLILVRINNMADQTRKCQDDSAQIMLMSMLKTELARWKDRWLGPNPIMTMHPDCLTMTRFYCALFSYEIDVLQLEIASASTPPDLTQMQPQTSTRGSFSGFETASPGSEQVVAFSNCISSALTTLRILVTDLPSFLCYAQDAVTFGSARVGLWLVKNIARMPPLAKDAVYDALKQATVVCRSVTKDPRDTSAYQARFFASLIHVAIASRAASVASKPASPTPHGNGHGLVHTDMTPVALAQEPIHIRRPSDASGLFDVYQANDAAGVDLSALDQQLEGGAMGWPFPAELGDDQNVDLDEMFADLSAWFPSTHGEQAPVATSGWGGGAAGGEEIYLGNGDADVWNGGGGVRGL